jgi:hypothetical protein
MSHSSNHLSSSQQRHCPSTQNSLRKNSMKIVIEGERNDHFILLEEHFFAAVLLYKKIMESNLKTYKSSGTSFVID